MHNELSAISFQQEKGLKAYSCGLTARVAGDQSFCYPL
jgi:hypothetical protein